MNMMTPATLTQTLVPSQKAKLIRCRNLAPWPGKKVVELDTAAMPATMPATFT